ncbi:MAG: ATP-binding protein [Nannocystaceae bacterium]|nr:response regulator [Myxococcales bacterium]
MAKDEAKPPKPPAQPPPLTHDKSRRRDVTPRVTRVDELSREVAELREALAAKDKFFAEMSHEFRTPLTAILGLSEALREEVHGPLNDGQGRYVDGIIESGQHLLSLINDILDLSKYKWSGGIDLETEPVEVRELCDSSVRMVQTGLERKRLSLRVTEDPLVSTLVVDRRRMKQVLVNLLSNAVKFTPEGGQVGIEISGHPNQQQARIVVWDTGPGIPEGEIGKLFRPYVQLDGSIEKREGTGLGLALVRALTELHGGSVSVASEPGKGSRFTLALPWSGRATVDPTPTPTPDAPPRWEVESFTGQTLTDQRSLVNAVDIIALARKAASEAVDERPVILVIDDNAANLRTLSDYLRIHGYRVSTANNGVEGFEKALRRRPAVAITDIQMPGMSGLEVIRRLRRTPETRGLPIVALTALATPSDRRRCIEAGATYYFSKPISLSRLLKTVQQIAPLPNARAPEGD